MHIYVHIIKMFDESTIVAFVDLAKHVYQG